MDSEIDLGRVKRNVAKMVSMNAPAVDIDRYIAEQGTSVEAVRAYKAEPTKSAIYDGAQQFGENFNKGLYSTLNAPTSLANMAMDAAGFDFRFKRPLEAALPSLDNEIMTTPEPQTNVGRYAGTIGEYAGANALPAGGMIVAAPRVMAATSGATSLLGQSANRLATGIAANPGTAAAGEMLSTLGSGTGAQIARDVAPDSATAEFVGASVGGIGAPMAMAASPANLTRKAVRTVKKRISPAELEKQQRKQIADGIRQNLTPEGEAAIRETADIQQGVPGFKPSVAEATESPSFIATQREFESGLSGPDLDLAKQRYSKNAQAIGDAVAEQAPRSTLSPDDIFGQARKRPAQLQNKLDGQLSQLDDAALAQAEGVAPRARRSTIGASIRDQIDIERDYVKGTMSQNAQDMGLNDTRKRFSFDQNIKQRLTNAVKPTSDLADKSALPNGIVADIQRMDDSVSVADLMALRSRITDDIRTNQARPDGKRKVQYLQVLKSELDNVSDTVIRGAGDTQLADNMRKFRADYRENLIEPFEQGSMGKVLKKDLGGAYRIPDEDVAREFFSGWNQTGAKQFRQVFKDTPSANATMEAAAIDDLFATAVLNDKIDANKLTAWTRRNAGALQEFPQIKGRVEGLQNAVDSIAKRRAVIMQRKTRIDNAYLSRELSRLDSVVGNTTPEAVIDQAVKNPARMQRLLRAIKTPEAKDAIARHVWESSLNASDPAAFIKRNGLSISPALGAERFRAAKRLARAIEKNRLVKPPAGQALDTNPMAAVENMLGTGLNQMSSRVFAVKSGRTSARYAFADIAGRAFRNLTANQARQTLQSAIYDPQVAIDLANTLEMGVLTQPSAKRIYTFLLSNGIVAATNDGERN